MVIVGVLDMPSGEKTRGTIVVHGNREKCHNPPYKLVRHLRQLLLGRVYMWMRPSWDSRYTRTETKRAKTPTTV